jgi:transcriptional regulator of heat shock response
MTDLTDRQTQILKTIVEEYTQTAEPVGSETLDKKYNLGVSPATIRNEMAYLSEQGYLKQPHTSAGRIPTPKSIKLYINELMREKQLSVTEEVSAKETIWEKRHQLGDLLRQATQELAQRTKSIGVAVTDDARVYHAGYSHILDLPEFYDIDVTRTVLSLLDEAQQLIAIFNRAVGSEPIHILVGDELGSSYLEPVSTVFADFRAGEHTGRVGIIGSCRLDYPYVIPLVRHFGQLISELTAA